MESVQEYEQKQRRKILIATVIMGVILIGVLVWAIVAAVNSGHPSASTDDTQPIIATEDNPASDTPGVSNDQTASNAESTDSTTANGSVTPPASSDLPATGPADLLPVAVLAGAAVALYLYNRRLVAERAPLEVFRSK